ncbi:MAG TPA: hypothetical protein VF222_00915 [Nitrososphaeraceae archaeon]
MMITSITRKPSKVFLVTLLVAGIITISSQSFMIGAQAQQDPIVDVEKLKCSNDNFNIDVTNSQVQSEVANKIQSLLAQEAADNSGKQSTDEDIVLVCTNNNNLQVVSSVG